MSAQRSVVTSDPRPHSPSPDVCPPGVADRSVICGPFVQLYHNTLVCKDIAAVRISARASVAAATPMMRLAVEMIPSLAPSTAALSQAARWT